MTGYVIEALTMFEISLKGCELSRRYINAMNYIKSGVFLINTMVILNGETDIPG